MIQFLPYDKYTKDTYKAYMLNNFLYIYNAGGLETVNVRGVFEDPEAVSEFDECDGGGCYDDSATDFPIAMDMLALINQGILSSELQLLGSSMSDTKNDRMQDAQTISGRSAAPKQ